MTRIFFEDGEKESYSDFFGEIVVLNIVFSF